MAAVPELPIDFESATPYEDHVRALLSLAYRGLTADHPSRVFVRELRGGKSGSSVFRLREQHDGSERWRVAKLGQYARISREYAAGTLLRSYLGTAGVPPELLLPQPGSLVPAEEGDAKTYMGFGLHLSLYAGGVIEVQSLADAFHAAISDGDDATDRILATCARLTEFLRRSFYANPVSRTGVVRTWYYVRRCPDLFIESEDFDPGTNLLLPLGASPASFASQHRPFQILCQEANSQVDLVDRTVGVGPLVPLLFEETLYLESYGVGRIGVLSQSNPPSNAFKMLLDQLRKSTPPPHLNIHGPIKRTRFSVLCDALAHLHPDLPGASELSLGDTSLPNPLYHLRSSLFSETSTTVALGHGDLHPGNVLIAGDTPYVIDFGSFSVADSGSPLEYPVQGDLARLGVRLAATIALHYSLEELAAVWIAAGGEPNDPTEAALAKHSAPLARLARILRTLRTSASGSYVASSGANPDIDWWACIFGECLRLASGGDPSYEAEAALVAASVATAFLRGTSTFNAQGLLAAHDTASSPAVASFAWSTQEQDILQRIRGGGPFMQRVVATVRSARTYFGLRLRQLAQSEGWSVHPLRCSLSWRRDTRISRDALWARVQRALGRLSPSGRAGDWQELATWTTDNLSRNIVLFLDDPLFSELPQILLDDLSSWLSALMLELAKRHRLVATVLLYYERQPLIKVPGVTEHPELIIGPYAPDHIAACLAAHGAKKDEANRIANVMASATRGDPAAVEGLLRQNRTAHAPQL